MANEQAWWTKVALHEALLICAGQHVTAAYEAEAEAKAKAGDVRAVSFAAVKASQHAGAVVELLAKSLLAKEHPALILSDVADAIPSPQHPLELKRTSEAARLLTLLRIHLGLDPKIETLGGSILQDRNYAGSHRALPARRPGYYWSARPVDSSHPTGIEAERNRLALGRCCPQAGLPVQRVHTRRRGKVDEG